MISQCLLDGVHAAADAHHLSVVVLAGQRGGLDAPGQCTAHPGNLVRGDLLAVARAADHDAEAPGSASVFSAAAMQNAGIVVFCVVDVSPAVDRLVAAVCRGAR